MDEINIDNKGFRMDKRNEIKVIHVIIILFSKIQLYFIRVDQKPLLKISNS